MWDTNGVSTMSITKEGLKRVDDALVSALKQEAEARRQLDDASERVDELREAVECDHSKLEDAGSFMYMQTVCKKCGFMWQD